MSRQCSVCSHPARPAITDLLIRRTSYRKIADRFGVSETALSRHVNEHLAEYVQQALSAYDEREGVKVLSKLMNTLSRLDAFLDAAEAEEDARGFVVVAAELRKELELVAKLQGELDDRPVLELHLHPQWAVVRSTLVTTLGSFPEARAAVIGALEEAVSTNGRG